MPVKASACCAGTETRLLQILSTENHDSCSPTFNQQSLWYHLGRIQITNMSLDPTKVSSIIPLWYLLLWVYVTNSISLISCFYSEWSLSLTLVHCQHSKKQPQEKCQHRGSVEKIENWTPKWQNWPIERNDHLDVDQISCYWFLQYWQRYSMDGSYLWWKLRDQAEKWFDTTSEVLHATHQHFSCTPGRQKLLPGVHKKLLLLNSPLFCRNSMSIVYIYKENILWRVPF